MQQIDASLTPFIIRQETADNVVSLRCMALSCKHNLMNSKIGVYCNLKHITVTKEGACFSFIFLGDKTENALPSER
jgi:hypothetical protein